MQTRKFHAFPAWYMDMPQLMNQSPSSPDMMATEPAPGCYVCGAEGHTLYSGLTDPHGSAPGE